MNLLQYLDFDLAIQKNNGAYSAHVLDSPGGQAKAACAWTLTDDEINAFFEQIGAGKRRGGESERAKLIKTFGGKLFNSIFADAVRERWEAAMSLAQLQEKGLRLHLRLNDVPELADLPWELLYDDATNRFFNLSVNTPLVRYLEMPNAARALQIQPPLRILGVTSLPDDYEELTIDREWDALQEALQELIRSGLVELYRLEDATTGKLQEALRKNEYHILHFIGHGEQDKKTGEGALVFENERGRGRLVSGEMLGTLLRDARTLRLAILNACEGARQDRTDAFGGVAQRLVQQTIPAVIAMQFEISDRAARTFAKEFYAALADNYPIEAAVGEARKAIFGLPNELEWATPVLYSRSPDGMLFDLRGLPTAPPIKPGAAAQVTSAANETLSFDVLMQRANRARNQGERILAETPVEPEAWGPKFQEAQAYLKRADALQPENPRVLLAMLQTQARLSPENSAPARDLARRIEDLIADSSDAAEQAILAQTYLIHATLSSPPNEKLLSRAGNLYLGLNDLDMTERVRKMLKRIETSSVRSLADLYGEPDVRFASPELATRAETPLAAPPTATPSDFNPVGEWDFRLQDETETHLRVSLTANGNFQLMQLVGTYHVPVTGSWLFNPLTQTLAMQGVINTFQPFTLNLTLTGKIGDAFSAVGADGVSYILTRVKS